MKLTLTLTLPLMLALPAFAAFPNGYSYCKVLTTQHTMVSGTSDLTNYPLTVVLTDTDLRTTGNGGLVNNSNGYDIGFYPDCSGSGTALKWEMESYSPATGAIVAHVLRPTLSHTVNDTIGMSYGGSFSTFQSTASAVWDANYRGVWHLPNGTSLNANDSTSNALKPVSTNGTSATASGKIDGAASLNGSSNYIDYGAVLNITSAVTYSAWFYLNADLAGAAKTVIEKGYDGSSTGLSLSFNSGCGLDGTDRLTVVSYGGGCVGAFDASTTISKNTWFYAVATWDASAWHVYTNGVDHTTAFGPPRAPFSSGARFEIGSEDVMGSPSRFIPGVIDEVRVSSVARTADWILTEYRNQSAPGTYISAGSRVTGTAVHVRHVVIGGL